MAGWPYCVGGGQGWRGPIVGCVDHGLGAEVAAFAAHGADHVLPKPFDVDDFNGVMRRLGPGGAGRGGK